MKSAIYNFLFFFILISSLAGCSDKEVKPFSNLSGKNSGVDFNNKLNQTRDQNILDYLYFYNGGGVSIGDINNDGLEDIYFTGNQVKNRLYLNKGNLKFEDITEEAGVAGNSTWNTGTTMADVNGDGLLDIYVSAVVGINGFVGHNELFINNGDLSFTESSSEYGLYLENYTSQAAFFDLENDGDLDVYILNHAIHTNESFGPADIRNKRVEESGDKLFLNENGKFRDISEEAGIFGGANSYGLGLSTADFNNDGFTDIYVGNDFHEDDYYYLNNGDGTFTESLKSYFGHVSRFSMGNDVADINNDGFPDLITLDMLPEDEKVLKSSAGDENVNLHALRTERLGYHPQYTRNMLHLNNAGQFFSETALLSGIAATDWSWGALFVDLDLDGSQDLFISNGIPKRPNDLDYIKFTSNDQIRNKLDKTTLVDKQALEKMPSGKVTNYVFKGNSKGMFENMSEIWISNDSIISTGVAYGDLDNDGDIDIVTNNINSPASIYINDSKVGDYLKVHLRSSSRNSFGIGTKAILYTNGGKQFRQLYTTKAFQSSSAPFIHFGVHKDVRVDSLVIIWPDKSMQTIKSPTPNSEIIVDKEDAVDKADLEALFYNSNTKWFTPSSKDYGIDYVHRENLFNDFDVQKLIPHRMSDLGPGVQVVDLNGDDLDDVVFGGSKFSSPQIYYQGEYGFFSKSPETLASDSIKEDTDLIAADFDNNGLVDILIVSGGGEAIGKDDQLLDRLYFQQSNGDFEKDPLFPKLYSNSSIIRSADYDNDGDLDVFIGSNAVNYNYGKLPRSYLLSNESGKFTVVKNSEIFEDLGMINDGIWDDFDNDGDPDLIVIGEWMAPKFLENDNGNFRDVSEKFIPVGLNGLWQKIIAFDIDRDGDQDYLLGNWGLNSKLTASKEDPLLMYYRDFDDNGLTETLLATAKEGDYYFLHDMDELAGQLSQLIRKRFNNYHEFAGKKVNEIFKEKELESAEVFRVHTLASGYLENRDGKFEFVQFKNELQTAPIRAMLNYDFNNDGKDEVLIGGNYFGVTPYHGKFDGMGGSILISPDKILNSIEIGLNLSQKAVKNFSVIEIGQKPFLLVTINDRKTELYEIKF